MATKKQKETEGNGNVMQMPNMVQQALQPQPQPQVYLTDEMVQAIDVLIQGVEIAQSKAAFTLQDAGVLSNAVNVLTPYVRK